MPRNWSSIDWIELFAVSGSSGTPQEKKLTDLSAQAASWPSGTLEVVSWKSQDGAAIEGVLHKPADFDASKKYPLLVVIHGGPTGISRAVPFTSTIYPIDVWVPRGAASSNESTNFTVDASGNQCAYTRRVIDASL